MLVLSRKAGETIHIGGDIVVTVLAVTGGRIRLGIEAPAEVSIKRGELIQRSTDSSSIAGDYARPRVWPVMLEGSPLECTAGQEPCPAI